MSVDGAIEQLGDEVAYVSQLGTENVLKEALPVKECMHH